jgi:hypothetical protein
MMSDNVGIMRTGEDVKKAIDSFPGMNEKLRTVACGGLAHVQPGWHLWADMQNMLLVAEVVAKAALQREESRGAHTRLDFPRTDSGGYWESVNSRATSANGAVSMGVFESRRCRTISNRSWRVKANEPDGGGTKVTFRVLRGEGGDNLKEVSYDVEAETGWVVLDAVLNIQAHQAPIYPCAGTARPPSVARAAPK